MSVRMYVCSTYEDFMAMAPCELYTNIVSMLYRAVQDGDSQTVDDMLSVFDNDARRSLCIGLAALRCLSDNDEHGKSIKQAIGRSLYEHFNDMKK